MALSSVFWMDPQSWLSRAFASRISASRTVLIGSFRASMNDSRISLSGTLREGCARGGLSCQTST